MCGIAGIWNRTGEPVDRAVLERMGALLVHRGPDGDGVWVEGDVGLANRRLAIIDPTEAGAQPMGLPDRGLWLTYNGEIHNYVELRRELEAAGARFRTGSDTEVVLHAYARWGVDCFERFNGMWALALWDERDQELVLSRDRFAIKPLCYVADGGRVHFASEAKALLAAVPDARAPDRTEIAAFLVGRRTDRGERTFFERVKNVPPATSIVFTREGERRVRYWRFQPGDETPRDDAEEQFRELLLDAVRLRRRSDVPVGACLSGGLDSSAIVRLLDDADGETTPCFCLRYDDHPGFDESRYAALAAEDRPVKIHWVRPDPRDMVATIRRIVWHHDAPMPVRGRFPQWFVMEEAGRHVKVVLGGQGGDELLAGYDRFVTPYIVDRLGLRRSASARPQAPLARELIALAEIEGAPRFRTLARTPARALWRRYGAANRAAGRVRSREFAAAFPEPRDEPKSFPYRSRLNNELWAEFTQEGLPELLHAEDALGMAFSVESRLPFVDHRLVEFCFSLPFSDKISHGWTKSLLRRALTAELPPEIRTRRRKLGFPAPVGTWLSRPDNWEGVRELLLDPRCLERGIFDRRRLERALADFPEARRSGFRTDRVWRWLTLELWFRDFVDSRIPSPG
jgi:asparagine synthase (glutamine-hydrolysing)